MEITFTHRITFPDYKKSVVQAYYFKNKKRLYGYSGMMLAGVLVIVFKLTNAFGLSDRYPEETLFIVGGSLIISPLLLYRAVIRNAKQYYNSNPVFGSEVKYVLDEDKISYETYHGNTGAYKWKNINNIEEGKDFIRIILPDKSAFLFVKNNLDNRKLNDIQEFLKHIQ
jgi:hypothetical protein